MTISSSTKESNAAISIYFLHVTRGGGSKFAIYYPMIKQRNGNHNLPKGSFESLKLAIDPSLIIYITT